jgi:hypothetical protein
MASDAYWRGIKSQLTDPPPISFLSGAGMIALVLLSASVVGYVFYLWVTQ